MGLEENAKRALKMMTQNEQDKDPFLIWFGITKETYTASG